MFDRLWIFHIFVFVLRPSILPSMAVTPLQVPDVNCTDDLPNCHEYGNDICTDYKPWATAHCNRHCGFCIGPSTTPLPCVNTRTNCAEFGTYICTSVELIGWTKQNCAKYCGLCGGGPIPTEPKTTPTPMNAAAIAVSGTTNLHPVGGTTIQVSDGNCTDTLPNCHQYGNDICTDYKPWAIAHCSRHCGFCTGHTTTPPPCKNSRENCAEFGSDICTSLAFLGWTKENCAQYCGLCDGGPVPTQPKTTPTSITKTTLTTMSAAASALSGKTMLQPMVVPTIKVPGDNCTDELPNCHDYGNDICRDYTPWATAHCSRHCGFCTGAATTPPPCVNTKDNCAEYGTYICTSVALIGWTKQNCAKYCGLCGP